MAHRVSITEHIPERTTRLFDVVFRDDAGTAIVPTTVVGTLFDERTQGVINSRSAQNVKDVNNGAFAGTTFTLTLAPADTAIIGTGRTEDHVYRLDWTHSGGRQERTEILHTIVNLALVP